MECVARRDCTIKCEAKVVIVELQSIHIRNVTRTLLKARLGLLLTHSDYDG